MVKQGLILVVDDDRSYSESLQGILEEEGYVVKTAGNGKEALDILSRLHQRVDLITLDIEMPGMHGLEFLQRIERLNKKIPILIASSKKGLKSDVTVVSAPQVKKFIGKPYNLDQLLGVLPEIIQPRPAEELSRVLMVADLVAEHREQSEQFFESQGFIVRMASDRESLLTLLRRLGPVVDGVLVDLDLLGGVDTWTRLDEEALFLDRLDAACPAVPIYLTSAKFRAREAFSKYRKVQDVLMKPIDLPKLLTLFQTHFSPVG